MDPIEKNEVEKIFASQEKAKINLKEKNDFLEYNLH